MIQIHGIGQWHIDNMAINNQDVFGKSVQDHWKALEKQFIVDQEKKDIEYYALKDQPGYKSCQNKVTKMHWSCLIVFFQHFKEIMKN